MNRNIVEYMVARAYTIDSLVSEVDSFINQGWQPIGGIDTLMYSEDDVFFYQSMVKYED